MKEMTPTIVNKLIRRIEVRNPEKKHARKSVKVDIYFTAVGLVSLPDEQEIRRMMEQVRSASQLPKQLTATRARGNKKLEGGVVCRGIWNNIANSQKVLQGQATGEQVR